MSKTTQKEINKCKCACHGTEFNSMKKPTIRIREIADKRKAMDEEYLWCHINAIGDYLDEEKERVNFALKEIIRMFSNQGPDEDNINYLHDMIDETLTDKEAGE